MLLVHLIFTIFVVSELLDAKIEEIYGLKNM